MSSVFMYTITAVCIAIVFLFLYALVSQQSYRESCIIVLISSNNQYLYLKQNGFFFFCCYKFDVSIFSHVSHGFTKNWVIHQLKKIFFKIIFYLFLSSLLISMYEFNAIQDGPFRGSSQVREQKGSPSLKYVTQILQWWNLALLNLT